MSSSISSSEAVRPRGATRRFFVKLALFGLSLALFPLVVAAGLVYIGEAMPLEMVVALQTGDAPVLYRPRFSNRDMAYKLLMTERLRPDVVALGSSRTLQLRAGMFNRDPDAFYNAGMPGLRLDGAQTFLERLDPDAAPRVLLLAIDPPWFLASFDPAPPVFTDDDWRAVQEVAVGLIAAAGRGERLDLELAFGRREPWHGGLALGLRAIADGHGFRNDGSEQYGDFLVAHHLWPENERAKHLDWARDGQIYHAYADQANTQQLDRLRALLALCQERGIEVVGFTPPYMPTLYDQLMASERHAYLPKLMSTLDEIFAEYGYTHLSYLDGERLPNTADTDFFDGWHSSERVHLYLMIEMARALPDVFAPYIDVEALEDTAEDAGNTWDVYGIDP